MKQWLLKTKLFAWAYQQGGIDAFQAAHQDIWSTMKDDVEKMADVRADRKLESILTAVDERMIVKLDAAKGIIFIGDERPEESRLNNLKAEAEFLMGSDIWKILYESPKALAQKTIFMSGENLDDVKKGRAVLYLLDTQQRIIDLFRNRK